MGSVSVSSCRWCMFISCVHHVAVFNAEICVTCSLLMLVEYARGKHMEETNSRGGLMTALEMYCMCLVTCILSVRCTWSVCVW